MRRVVRIQLCVVFLLSAVAVLRLSLSLYAKEAAPLNGVAVNQKASIDAPPSPPLPPSPPPPSPSSPSPPSSSPETDRCYAKPSTEYDGPVVIWGAGHIVDSAADCCAACTTQRASEEAKGKAGCRYWVWCADKAGCGTQKFGECWGKGATEAGQLMPKLRASGDGIPWMSGAAFTAAEAAEVAKAAADAERAIVDRRERPGNPRVFFEVDISPSIEGRGSGANGGRIEFVLYAHESPRAAENFRAMCTGERGGKQTYTGMRFYRILDLFIDQAGAGEGSIWGGAFDDDPGGLRLRHERAGLLSAANSGPNTNSGHFSIVVSPAPHLDGGYTIFGEVVSGMDVVMAINRIDKYDKGRKAVVRTAGCMQNCAPRPEVQPKCKTHEAALRPVQGKPILPCVD